MAGSFGYETNHEISMQMGRILYSSGRLTQAFLLLLRELAVAIKF
jgi:hypothetical protein